LEESRSITYLYEITYNELSSNCERLESRDYLWNLTRIPLCKLMVLRWREEVSFRVVKILR